LIDESAQAIATMKKRFAKYDARFPRRVRLARL
jgi:hypothetical protein